MPKTDSDTDIKGLTRAEAGFVIGFIEVANVAVLNDAIKALRAYQHEHPDVIPTRETVIADGATQAVSS